MVDRSGRRKAVTVTLPSETRAQLTVLADYYGSKSGAIVVAIAALYRDTMGGAVEPVTSAAGNRGA